MSADNKTLLSVAAECWPCSNRSISPACQAHSIKPTTCCCWQMGRKDGRTPYSYIDPAAYYASSVNNCQYSYEEKPSQNTTLHLEKYSRYKIKKMFQIRGRISTQLIWCSYKGTILYKKNSVFTTEKNHEQILLMECINSKCVTAKTAIMKL